MLLAWASSPTHAASPSSCLRTPSPWQAQQGQRLLLPISKRPPCHMLKTPKTPIRLSAIEDSSAGTAAVVPGAGCMYCRCYKALGDIRCLSMQRHLPGLSKAEDPHCFSAPLASGDLTALEGQLVGQRTRRRASNGPHLGRRARPTRRRRRRDCEPCCWFAAPLLAVQTTEPSPSQPGPSAVCRSRRVAPRSVAAQRHLRGTTEMWRSFLDQGFPTTHATRTLAATRRRV